MRIKETAHEMYGWRAKIGLIIPENNAVMEHEFNRVAPEGVSIHSFRVYSELSALEKAIDYERQLTEVVKTMLPLRPDIVVYACDSGSFSLGVGHDEILAKKIRMTANAQATTTATSTILGLRRLGLKRISVATPFSEEVNQKLRSFLLGNGIEVTNIDTLGEFYLPTSGATSEMEPKDVYRLAKHRFDNRAEGLYIGCTNLKTMETIEQIENDLGKPVVSASQATIWASLRMVGIHDLIQGYGSLLATP